MESSSSAIRSSIVADPERSMEHERSFNFFYNLEYWMRERLIAWEIDVVGVWARGVEDILAGFGDQIGETR